MIVKSVLEIVLHLESFRNIELYYQGLYLVKINVYDAPNGWDRVPPNIMEDVVHAHPYAHTESYNPYEQEHDKVYDSQVLRPAFIQDSTSSFYSKSFVIKYCQEEVELNDFVHFRLEYEIADEDRSHLYVEASLLFYDYMNSKNSNEREIKEEQFEEKLLSTAKTVCVKRLAVNNPKKGLHEFHPILFDEQYFCEMKMTVHSVSLDYRFRASTLQLADFARMSNQERQQLVEASRKTEKKNVSLFSSVCKSLELKVGGNELETIERLLVKEPKQLYNRLLNHCVTLVSKCVLEKDRKLFNSYLDIPCLKLTNEEDKSQQHRSIRDSQSAVHRLFSENQMICAQLVQLWHKVLDIYRVSPRLCVLFLENQWVAHQTSIWKHNVHQKYRPCEDLSLSLEPDTEKDKVASQLRSTKRHHAHSLHELSFAPKPEQLPIIFEDMYCPSGNKTLLDVEQPIAEEYRGIHLFVFVHGFQGNSYDMRMIKNYISFRHPQSLFLCSSSNEDLTNGDILEMGIRLANEVKEYVRDNCPHQSLGRLSFLGHSLGGLKIRAALPYLSDFKDRMYTYVSFSSPHLGLFYNSSSLIDAGIWVLNKMKNSLCLKQLSMEDAENLQDTVLYKLSEYEGLRWFKHIFLFGSRQDSYSPYESARMEICRSAYSDKKNGNKYINMVRNLVTGIEHNRLHRLDVSFCIQQRNLDSFIGRTAHIMFLQCQPLIKTIVFSYDYIFS